MVKISRLDVFDRSTVFKEGEPLKSYDILVCILEKVFWRLLVGENGEDG